MFSTVYVWARKKHFLLVKWGLDDISEPPDDVWAGNLEWCKHLKRSIEEREIDCLCCQEVVAINSKFDQEYIDCVTKSIDFETLCINKLVLTNVLNGLHKTRRDFLEENCFKHLLRYGACKQFIWWGFKNLGKGNRRVNLCRVLWKMRNLYPGNRWQICFIVRWNERLEGYFCMLFLC